MSGGGTKTDVGAAEWTIDDAVTRMRVWGSDRIYAIAGDDMTLGAAEACAIRLDDPTERVSRQHARLLRENGRLLLRDLGSKNGIHLDGARREELIVEPGIEIGIGGLTLLAESPRLIALRGFLARILGWSGERIETVDLALRAVRVAASRRAPLVLAGDGDLVAIARAIHLRALGPERPFILCDPRRRPTTEIHELGMPAFATARGGSLCISSQRLPRDFSDVRTAVRDPSHRVLLAICTQDAREPDRFAAAPITIPSLTTRAGEVRRGCRRGTRGGLGVHDSRSRVGARALVGVAARHREGDVAAGRAPRGRKRSGRRDHARPVARIAQRVAQPAQATALAT